MTKLLSTFIEIKNTAKALGSTNRATIFILDNLHLWRTQKTGKKLTLLPLHPHASKIGKTNPLFCGCEMSTLWHYYHPSPPHPRSFFWCLNFILVQFFNNPSNCSRAWTFVNWERNPFQEIWKDVNIRD